MEASTILEKGERVSSPKTSPINIVVATDGSTESTKALDIVKQLAEKVRTNITIVSVVSPRSVYPPDVSRKVFEYEEYVRIEGRWDSPSYETARTEMVVEEAVRRVATEGSRAKTIVEYGNPSEKILEVAESERADFIVVGFKGLHGLGRLRALGSVSRNLMENSKIPVIVVPD